MKFLKWWCFYDGTKLTTSAKTEKRQTDVLKIDVAGVYIPSLFNSWVQCWKMSPIAVLKPKLTKFLKWWCFYDGTKVTTIAKTEKRQTDVLKIDVAGVYIPFLFNSWVQCWKMSPIAVLKPKLMKFLKWWCFYDGTKLTTSAKTEKGQTDILKIDVAGV